MLSGFVIAGLVLAAAATGGFFKPGEWYDSLNKPVWTPPSWAFPVVWTVLYCMIGYAGWLVWGLGATFAFVIWVSQLLVNGLWSYLFFGAKNMKAGMVDVVLLWAFIAAFIIVTYPVSQLAALLFLPYLLWVSIAALLNLRMIQLNPSEV
jgi:tryptophan-rich sensory protein